MELGSSMSGKLLRRLFYIVIDQLAGHWADGIFVSGDLPPANVRGYHELGLTPNISRLIEGGLWVERPWNRGGCDTRHGMKYLSTGTYDMSASVGFFEYVKEKYKENVRVAVFTTTPWAMRGYFYVPDYVVSLPPCYGPYYDDWMVWALFVRPYLEREENWDMIHFYMPINDIVSHCPSYQEHNPHPKSSKHAYLLHLDKLIGEIVRTLEALGHWSETVLVLASDHGYHLGCDVARRMGARSANWCCDHGEPWDCVVWDFERDEPTGVYSGGPRRVTFIVSGGGLPERLKGVAVKEAEIIDVIPTVAKLLGVEFRAEGRSLA